MADPARIHLFCEDVAHEEFLRGLLLRLCAQERMEAIIAIRNARGGRGRALSELDLYQALAKSQELPDLLVVGIDTNCSTYAETRDAVEARLDTALFPFHAVACPNPHIELWYMADPVAFERVVGVPPPELVPGCGKEDRNVLKKALAAAIREAGHPVLFGGTQFALEIAQAIDPFRAGKVDAGFRHFVRDVTNALRRLRAAQDGSGHPSSPAT